MSAEITVPTQVWVVIVAVVVTWALFGVVKLYDWMRGR